MREFGKPFDFRDGPPADLMLAKPREQDAYDRADLTPRPGQWPPVIMYKANGWRTLILVTPNLRQIGEVDIRMFTDGGHKRIDAYMPHAVAELRSRCIPPMTFLVAEAVSERNDRERLGAVTSILLMGNAQEAVSRQNREGPLKLILHGALCWHGEWLSETPFDQVLDRLVSVALPNHGKWVRSVGVQYGTMAEIQARVIAEDREGLVITHRDYCTTWSVGDPNADNPRPDGCYKWKPRAEGDFIAGFPVMSTTRPGRIKKLKLMQIDPVSGRLFDCGHLRNFSAEVDAQLQKRGFPVALEVRFDGRTPAGKLIAPLFIRIRDDKTPPQCLSSRSFDEAKFV